MMKQLLLGATWACASLMGFAQTAVTGSVVGANEQPLAGAIVFVYTADHSTIYKALECDSTGAFSIDLNTAGMYFFMATYVGHLPKESSTTIDGSNNNVALEPLRLSEITTATVDIVQRVNYIERKLDRLIVHPEALVSNAGGTVYDALLKSPGIMADGNGGLMMNGRAGVVVYFDDQPTYLNGNDLITFLKSTPIDAVATIELMANPTAKYDAEGRVGLILLRMKKLKTRGTNAALSLSYGQGRYMRSNNSAQFNYRINKLNFFSSLSYAENNSYQDLTIRRKFFNDRDSLLSNFNQRTYLKLQNASWSGRVGADYYVSPKWTLGATFNGFSTRTKNPGDGIANATDALNALVTRVETKSPNDRHFLNGALNLNSAWVIDSTGKNLSVQADYVAYDSKLDQGLATLRWNAADGTITPSNLVSQLPSTIRIASAKTDYTHPIGQQWKLETGAKVSDVRTTNVANFFDEQDGTLTPNYTFTNNFEYHENISAGYGIVTYAAPRFQMQGGLRFEATRIVGNQLGNPVRNDSTFHRNYNNWFPTVFAMYALDTLGKNALSLSMSRRIDRPNYQDMNPFTYPLDLFTLYSGNPYLQPTYSNNVELTYSYNNQYSITALASETTNMISETIEQGSAIFYSRPGNIGRAREGGVQVNINSTWRKWLRLQCSASWMYGLYTATLYGEALRNKGSYGVIAPTFILTLPKTWTLEAGGSYQTKVPVAQFVMIPVGAARFAVAKKVLHEKASLKLVLNDAFFTNQPGGDIKGLQNSTASWYSLLDTRVLTLSFSYRFTKGENLKARLQSAADDEKNRVK